MNQPAKAQEPSMEEILASIRRIISDDDAKPAAAPAEAAAAAPAPAAPKPAAAKPATTPPPPAPSPVAAPAPTPAPAAKNSQDDIDAMLASFDAPAPAAAAAPAAPEVEEAEDVFELTEQMAVPAAAADGFQKVDLWGCGREAPSEELLLVNTHKSLRGVIDANMLRVGLESM